MSQSPVDEPVDQLIQLLMTLEHRYENMLKQFQDADRLVKQIMQRSTDEKTQLSRHLSPLMLDPLAEPDLYRRAAVGRVLGLLDLDQRKGLGLTEDHVPDIDWVEIPSGEFSYGQDEKRQLPTFYISRYHTTYRQFMVFIEAEDGFSDPRWWAGLAEKKERFEVQRQPPEQAFPFWNHPFDGACWYDAIAFCRWWSHRLGGEYDIDAVMQWKIRLPTESEWEKAARGEDGRLYPWGNNFISGYANLDETDRYDLQRDPLKPGKIGQYFCGAPTAAGIFPQGASPYGVMDLIGTMWDLTLTEYRHGKDEDLRDYYPRVMRGGTWFVNEAYCRNDQRTMIMPFSRTNADLRKNDYGFRVVTREPLL